MARCAAALAAVVAGGIAALGGTADSARGFSRWLGDYWWHLEFAAPTPVDVLLHWPTAPRMEGPTFARTRDVDYAWSLRHIAEGGVNTIRELRPRTAFTCVLKDVLDVEPGRYKLLAMLNLATPGAPFYERKTVNVSARCVRPCE